MSFQQRAYQFYLSRGYAPAQAAALASNAMAESSGRTNAVGDSGKAYGAFQWHPGRQALLRSYAQREGLDPTSERAQLGYKDWELRNTERRAGDLLRAANDPVAANNAVLASLRPAGFTRDNPTGAMHYDKRLANTQAILAGNYSGYANADSPRENIAMGRDVPGAGDGLKTAEPVYGSDIGTSLRRFGNFLAPDLIDPATPLNPSQIAEEKKSDEMFGQLAAAGKSFAALQQASTPREQQYEMLRDQIVRPQFRPIPKIRGLLG